MHRDFKPANVFLNNQILKIGDFGLSKMGFDMTKTCVGTPLTQSPEILLGLSNQYGNKIDLWSIGITFHCMLFGLKGPFPAASLAELKEQVKKISGKNITIPEEIPVSVECKD